MVGVFERVYEIGPVFRAEPHDSPRHLNEFLSVDAEMGFITDHTSVMQVVNKAIIGMIETLQKTDVFDITVSSHERLCPPSEIPSIPFWEAMEMIGREASKDLSGEPDLAPSHERWLSD